VADEQSVGGEGDLGGVHLWTGHGGRAAACPSEIHVSEGIPGSDTESPKSNGNNAGIALKGRDVKKSAVLKTLTTNS
jgi:hypothetical protein